MILIKVYFDKQDLCCEKIYKNKQSRCGEKVYLTPMAGNLTAGFPLPPPIFQTQPSVSHFNTYQHKIINNIA